ncbi:MAG: amidohydrolase [Oscillospiraceae bacterium]|jgi:amidohydrolase|nr:amidohydrolase [Oscillospiraceae bacterium]
MEKNFMVDQEMMVRVRRSLHMYPELEFDLPKTLATVRAELDAIGIPYEFEKYGPSSIVATINPDITAFTIGIRADMDALPIHEENDVSYRSKHDGKMHACGHDAHTAMLLGTAKALWAIRGELRCRIKLLFQPCEESRPSGAKTMCQHGVMREIDCIIMCHVNCGDPAGLPSSCEGVTNATSVRFEITAHGRAAHIASQNACIDALAIGVKIYLGIQMMISREADPFDTCVIAVGTMSAGTTTATNADQCVMAGSIRCLKDNTLAWAKARLTRLVDSTCAEMGGTGEVIFSDPPLPTANNDPRMHLAFTKSALKVTPKVLPLLPSPGGEDFAYYEREKPGLLFGLGMRNNAKGFNKPAHTNNWDIDEDALQVGAKLFCQFVWDNQDGIPGLFDKG